MKNLNQPSVELRSGGRAASAASFRDRIRMALDRAQLGPSNERDWQQFTPRR